MGRWLALTDRFGDFIRASNCHHRRAYVPTTVSSICTAYRSFLGRGRDHAKATVSACRHLLVDRVVVVVVMRRNMLLLLHLLSSGTLVKEHFATRASRRLLLLISAVSCCRCSAAISRLEAARPDEVRGDGVGLGGGGGLRRASCCLVHCAVRLGVLLLEKEQLLRLHVLHLGLLLTLFSSISSSGGRDGAAASYDHLLSAAALARRQLRLLMGAR